MNFRQAVVSLSLVLALDTTALDARVKRVEIRARTEVRNGKEFGDAGEYERITGRVYFTLAVSNPQNGPIVDLEKAVNLKDGELEFYRIRRDCLYNRFP